MNRMKRVRGAAVALALGAIGVVSLAACGGSPSASNAPAPKGSQSSGAVNGAEQHVNAKPAGTIVYSDWQFPDTLNSLQTTLAASYETIDSTTLNLLIPNQNAQLVPQLLSRVPTVKNGGIKDGGRIIVLKLRPGMTWSNGKPITNRDIMFGWQMYMDPVTGPACRGTCDQIGSIVLKGKYEADLHMKHVYAPVLANGLPPVYPHNWKALGTTPHQAAVTLASKTSFNYENPSYVTSGPYQVSQFINNDRIVLTPNPHYRGPGAAYAKKMIFAFYSDKQAMIAAAAQGQTNQTTDYTLADLKLLNSHANTFNVYNKPSFEIEHLELNSLDKTYHGKANPLHDVRVRQALALGLDRVAVLQSAFGVSRSVASQYVAYSPLVVTPHFVQPFGDKKITGQWDPIAHRYLPYGKKAVADAKKLLAQAGYPHGFNLDLMTTQGNTVRSNEYGIIAKFWNNIGVVTHLVPTSPTVMFTDWNHNGPLNHGQFQAALFAFSGGADPDGFKTTMVGTFIDRKATNHSAVNQNYSGINDRVINNAFTTGAGTFNQAKRQAAYTKLQVEMNKMAYWIPLFARPSISTADASFTGFVPNPTLYGPQWNTFNWRPRAS